MAPLQVGFIGFGEAGFHIAKGLRSAGMAPMAAYDIHSSSEKFGPKIRQRAAETETRLVGSSEEIAQAATILISVVTADSARDAALQTAGYLTPDHIYADLNSISPALKRDIDRIIGSAGGRFVEAAVMAPVPPHGHRVPMLLGGPHATAFSEALAPYGMKFDWVSDNIGAAVAVKMCRSIVIKGLEALLLECVLGASQYNADERVFASLQESLPGIDWKKLADYMIGRVVVHGERRAKEMEEVAETLRSAGIEPLMAEATARRQEWSARLDLRSRFGPEGPQHYREVLAVLKNPAST